MYHAQYPHYTRLRFRIATPTSPSQHHYNYYKMITCYVFNFQRDVIKSMKIYMSLSPFIYLHFYIGCFLPYPNLYAKNHYIITRSCTSIC